MRRDEATVVAELLLRANEEHLAAFPEDVARAYRDELAAVDARSDAEPYVVEREGRVVATVTLVPDAGNDAHPWPPGGAVLRFLAVDPKLRGQGLGLQLTTFCVARARQLRVRYVALHTAPAMREARSVYERLGFVRTPEHDFDPAAHYVGAGDPEQPPWGLAYLLELDGV